MKIFAIRDEGTNSDDLMWLFYSERSAGFYLELPDKIDPFELPMPFDAYYRQGLKTILSAQALSWVRSRLVPPDRSNIQDILRNDVKIDEYDEYRLLLHAQGRCVQDTYYMIPIKNNELPCAIRDRHMRLIEEIMTLEDKRMLVFFKDGSAKLVNLTWFFAAGGPFAPMASNDELFHRACVQEDGFCVTWGEDHEIGYLELYANGEPVSLKLSDLRRFVAKSALSTAQAAHRLDCSVQYINELTRSGVLKPVKTMAGPGGKRNNYLYLDCDLNRLP